MFLSHLETGLLTCSPMITVVQGKGKVDWSFFGRAERTRLRFTEEFNRLVSMQMVAVLSSLTVSSKVTAKGAFCLEKGASSCSITVVAVLRDFYQIYIQVLGYIYLIITM